MMLRTSPIRGIKRPGTPEPGEEGYVLLGAIILVALFVIAMAVAAPRVAKELQRDRDLETMHRGKQYIRAIKVYYKRFNAYPPNIEALVKTNEIRFLRRRYIDPTTGKDDWKPIAFGQNKTPMAMGFFGQPLGGTGGNAIAGTGPSGGNGIDNGSSPGSGSTFGGSSSGGSFGGGISGGSSTPTGATGITGGTSGSPTSGTDSGGSSSLGGQTFGGGAVIGVSPMSPKQSIIVYKKMSHYNEWEFLYSPASEMQIIATGGSNVGGTPTTPSPTPTPTPSPVPQPQPQPQQ
jgi:type II secretory pathway pseudopilin PulG